MNARSDQLRVPQDVSADALEIIKSIEALGRALIRGIAMLADNQAAECQGTTRRFWGNEIKALATEEGIGSFDHDQLELETIERNLKMTGVERSRADLCSRCGHCHAPNMRCADGKLGFRKV